MPATLTESIEIDAAPSRVWAAVSQLSQMPRWSPTTRKVIVRGGQVREGVRTINLNKSGRLVWPTTSTVTAYEPERRIAFRVDQNRAVWRFDLEPVDGGSRTRLVQTRDVSSGTSKASQLLIDKLMGGEPDFEAGLGRGMRRTLERIKTQVEQAG